MEDVVIVGAGFAGLTCAAEMRAAGLDPLVVEKSRAPGGRCASRRIAGVWLNHGAQFVRARTPAFQAHMANATAAGHARPWPDQGESAFVGAPNMRALAHPLANPARIAFETEVRSLSRSANHWRIDTTKGIIESRALALTPPAPQTERLLRPIAPDLADHAGRATMAPAWAMMLVLAAPLAPRPPARPSDSPLAWICANAVRPGTQDSGHAWVLHAAPDWSRRTLDQAAEEIETKLLVAFEDWLGAPLPRVAHATAHRWRYALVETPLGLECIGTEDGTLVAGGDWCLGARVEAAWTSGRAMARKLLAARAQGSS